MHTQACTCLRGEAEMAARMYMCRGACTCIHSAVPESAMPTRRSRGGHHDIHVQTCTCIHSTVHESTMPTRRSRGTIGTYVPVQACTCIHSTEHESPMPMRRRRAEVAVGMYICRRARAYTALCTRVLCLRGEGEMAVGMYMCRRAHAYTAPSTRAPCL